MNPSDIESEAEIASLKLKLEASLHSKILLKDAIKTLEASKKDNPDHASIDASIARLKDVIAGDYSAIRKIQEKLLGIFERRAHPEHVDRVNHLTVEAEERVKRAVATAGKRPRGGV